MNVYTLFHHGNQEVLGVFTERYKAMEFAREYGNTVYPVNSPAEQGAWGMKDPLIDIWHYDYYQPVTDKTPLLQFTIEKHEVRQ